MGLGKDMVSLIEALAVNDIPKAKTYARVIVANDTAASRTTWRKVMANSLDNAGQEEIVIPSSIKGMLYVETPGHFRPGRHHMGPRELEVLNHVMDMSHAAETLMGMGIEYKNATMLVGESGVGKSMLARRIAWQMRLPLFYVNFANLVNSYMGATSGNVAHVFGFANTTPCVLMLDEVDTIAVGRLGAHDGPSQELTRVTITLMQEIDHMPASTVLLAATNRFDTLDAALVRRFSATYELMRPQDRAEVVDVVTRFLDDVGLHCSSAQLDGAVDRIASGYGHAFPTQSAIVSGLVEAIAGHVMSGRGSEDPVPMSWLGEMHP